MVQITSDIELSGAGCTTAITPNQLVQSSSENDNPQQVASANDQADYTRTASNEIHSQFKRLPNPDLVMYVFPHLLRFGAKGKLLNVPGWRKLLQGDDAEEQKNETPSSPIPALEPAALRRQREAVERAWLAKTAAGR